MLVLQPDPATKTALITALGEQGHEVIDVITEELDDALSYVKHCYYDILVVVKEINQRTDIFDLIQESRQKGENGIIITGLESPSERVKAFTKGADDCVPLNYTKKELLARINTLYLRVGMKSATDTILFGDLCLSLSKRTITANGTNLKLSPQEFAIMEFLVARKDRLVAGDEIEDSLEMTPNNIYVHINSIRKKAEGVYISQIIETVHRKGYVLGKCTIDS